jgi:hypothetical protein
VQANGLAQNQSILVGCERAVAFPNQPVAYYFINGLAALDALIK